MDTESIRQSYKPDTISLMLVGESPPANGKFFYVKSTMTTFTARAFEMSHKLTDNREFLEYFKSCGCYLDDLSHTPVDHLPLKNRVMCLRESVVPFAM